MKFLKAILNRLIPIGWQDEDGFHFGKPGLALLFVILTVNGLAQLPPPPPTSASVTIRAVQADPTMGTMVNVLPVPTNGLAQPVKIIIRASAPASIWGSLTGSHWDFFGLTCGSNNQLVVIDNEPQEFFRGIKTNEPVVLTWNADPDPATAGYNIYAGSITRSYLEETNVGDVTRAVVYVQDVEDTNYFAATSYDVLGNCSEPPKPQPQKAVPAIPFGQWPIPFRFLAAKAKPEETGLGDVIERLVGPIGGNTFKIWYKRITGKNCGCDQRKQKLNELYPLLKDD